MTEAQLYEQLGREHISCLAAQQEYQALLNLLGRIVVGEIDTSRVLVNITEGTYTIAPAGERPPMPARMNGLPLCLVAPEQPALQVVIEEPEQEKSDAS